MRKRTMRVIKSIQESQYKELLSITDLKMSQLLTITMGLKYKVIIKQDS